MATYQVRDGFFSDMGAINYSVLFGGTAVVSTKKMYVLDLDGASVDFRGTGFAYGADGIPKAGTVQKMFMYDDNLNQAVSFTGFEASVKQFVKAASTAGMADDQKLLAEMLSGKDRIVGADLSDGLLGYGGNDTLYGAGGADVLAGGAGRDLYAYLDASESTADAFDIILGFARGDKIGVSEIADFDFIGKAAFDGAGPQISYAVTGGDTYISADIDGDMNADMMIMLDGSHTLKASDFI